MPVILLSVPLSHLWLLKFLCHVSFSGLHALQRQTKQKHSDEPRGVCYPLRQPLPLSPVKVKRCHLSLCVHAAKQATNAYEAFGGRHTRSACRRRSAATAALSHHFTSTQVTKVPLTRSPLQVQISAQWFTVRPFLFLVLRFCTMSRARCLYLYSPGVMLSALRLDYGQNIPADVKQQVFSRAALLVPLKK